MGVLSPAEVAVLRTRDVHIHFPEGAVGKDGPSGGAALAAALVSVLSGRRLRADTAMTGELTLSGKILPVGGVRAKVLAAVRAGVRRVILPQGNLTRDVLEIPERIAEQVEFIGVDSVEDVLANALTDPVPPIMHAKL